MKTNPNKINTGIIINSHPKSKPSFFISIAAYPSENGHGSLINFGGITIFIVSFSTLNAQVKKVIKVKDFTEFKLEGSSTVYLIPSDTNGLVLEMKKDEVACYLDIDNNYVKLIINTTGKNKNYSKIFFTC